MPTTSPDTLQQRRRALLNLKSLFWCLHELGERYSLNLVKHSLEHDSLHPEIAFSNLGDNLGHLMEVFEPGDRAHLLDALDYLPVSRSSVDIGSKHLEVGHYVQAERSFGPIAEGSYGVICSVTPKLRGLFCLEGLHLMESEFAPSNVRTIFGTYVA